MKNNKKSVKIQTKGFSTHKQGDEPKDNQDAFSISQDQMRFAISDGASLSPKSGLWSRTLTKFFASDKYDFKTHTAESLSKWLEEPRKEWSDKAQIDKLPIPLKLKLKQLKGSVSTFVGCSIVNNPKKNRINILYVGDSTVFLIKNQKIKKMFPINNSSEFSSQTEFLGSSKERGGEEKIKLEAIRFDSKDSIIIATDELAKWIMIQFENKKQDWKKLLSMKENEFPKFVEHLRNSKQVDEDDMTFVICQRISKKVKKKSDDSQSKLSEFV